jgi:hypothetical protein
VTPFDDVMPPDEATIKAYLSNHLRGARAEAFEAFCLEHPEFSRRVEMDLYLTKGLRHIRDASAAKSTRPARRFGFAVAAGLTAVVACGLLLVSRAHPLGLTAYRSATDVPAALLTGPRVGITLVSLREPATEHRVVVPAGAAVVALRVMPNSAAGASGYAIGVALESALIARSVTLDGLKADNDGFIEIYLPVADIVGHTLRVAVMAAPALGTAPLELRLRVATDPSTPDATH